MNQKKPIKIGKLKKRRPKYDPTIEQLNQKATDLKNERSANPEPDRHHEIQSDQGRSTGLIMHGKRLKPSQAHGYLGSICVHVYQNKLSISDFNLLSLSPGVREMPQKIVQEALRELGIHCMTQFGVRLPKSLDPKKNAEANIKENL